MIEEKIDLQWRKFAWQLGVCLTAFAGGIYASLYVFTTESSQLAFGNSYAGALMGVLLVMGTFYAALWMMRVPYKKDMFERRLRNWSMTYAAIMMFVISFAVNIGFQQDNNGTYLITPHMMPGLWLVFYIIYAQYTRYCIAYGRRNSFTDGSKC